MKGLYILANNVLTNLKTIKFGMSMRIEHRWQDYLIIFSNAYYLYYYEILDDLTRDEILYIESQIIDKHLEYRNYDFQTEYFYCEDILAFHVSVLNILDFNKINYKFYNTHNFEKSYYDNKPDSLCPPVFIHISPNPETLTDIIKLTRYGQQEAFDKFKHKITLDYYWGLLLAPTGWGKTLMHNIFFGEYFKHNNKHAILLTKKKDLLNDINKSIKQDILNLYNSGFYSMVPDIEFCVDNAFDPIKINSLNKPTIIIINIDKLISKNNKDNINQNINQNIKPFDPLKKIKLIDWSKIGFIIFDEVHHIGSECVYTLMDYVKKTQQVKYCIGSSATPVRNNLDNQNNVRKLFNICMDMSDKAELDKAELDKADINILYEITYKEAWDNQIILPIKIELILLKNMTPKKDKSKIIGWSYNTQDKQTIKNKIMAMLKKSYKRKIIFYTANRLSCLEWFEYLSSLDEFSQYSKYISFSMSGSCYKDNQSIKPELEPDNEILQLKISNKIQDLHITKEELEEGIDNFKSETNNCFLFVVGRATEGYDDRPLDIVFNLDPVIDRSILLEIQKMGRTTRLCDNKTTGYYVVPIIQTGDYIDNISKFMGDWINAIIQPICDKKQKTRPHTITEYSEIYNKIFNIDGFAQVEHQQIYDKVLLNLYTNITYKQAIKIIKHTIPKPNNKDEYYELCKQDIRLNKEPEKIFSNFNWLEYLSISRIYYDLDTCKLVIQKLLNDHPAIYKKLRSETCTKLCELDNKFPPNGLWADYYNVPISDLIKEKTKSNFIKKKIID